MHGKAWVISFGDIVCMAVLAASICYTACDILHLRSITLVDDGASVDVNDLATDVAGV